MGDPVAPLTAMGDDHRTRHDHPLPSVARDLHEHRSSSTTFSRSGCVSFASSNSGVRIHLSDERERQDATIPARRRARRLRRAPEPRALSCTNVFSIITRRARHRTSRWRAWNDSYQERSLAPTNNIPQREGGTHLVGLPRSADAHAQQYIEEGILQEREDPRSPAMITRRSHGDHLGQGSRIRSSRLRRRTKLVSTRSEGIVEHHG